MGGIERALVVHANNFAEKGFRISFISCLKGNHFYSLNKQVKLIEPNYLHNGGIISGLTFYPLLINFIRQQVKKAKPDVVLAFGDWFSPLVLLALYGLKFPVYISDRTSPDYKFRFPIPQLKKWLYPRSAGFIAQTPRAKVYKENIFGDRLRIKVIPNALPPLDFNKGRGIQKTNKILFVGRFEWEKDPEILIRAMSAIKEQHPDWNLEMAGTGPLLDKMKLLTECLHLSDKVIFLGKVKEVQRLYQESSIFVLPSIIEGFPNALIEAMSFGLPCICFADIPYESIVINKKNGIVLNKRDASNLAKAICDLIEYPRERERLGLHASEIKEKLSVDKIAGEVLTFMGLENM